MLVELLLLPLLLLGLKVVRRRHHHLLYEGFRRKNLGVPDLQSARTQCSLLEMERSAQSYVILLCSLSPDFRLDASPAE
jgi:hypothetical protein